MTLVSVTKIYHMTCVSIYFNNSMKFSNRVIHIFCARPRLQNLQYVGNRQTEAIAFGVLANNQ